MPTQPLNPALFEALQRRFGEVRITNAGQLRRVEYTPNRFRPGGVQTNIKDRGEQYAINCPFCGDKRGRLYLSYQYGQLDPVTKRNNNGLWFCQNEQCHRNRDNSRYLQAYTAIPVGRRATLPPTATTMSVVPTSTPTQAVVTPLPPGVLIDTLPASHPAVAYLANRGFDPHVLARDWGVGYCQHSPDNSFFASDRIIMPVWSYTHPFVVRENLGPLMLAGWQSRAIGDGDGRPRYMWPPGMEKSKLLYGLHLALSMTGPVWICEGLTDCWKVGPGATAVFGKTLSSFQKQLLVYHFVSRPIVLLLDSDAHKEADEICQQLQRARGLSEGDRRVVVADLPAGRNDPAECTQEEIVQATDRALGYQW